MANPFAALAATRRNLRADLIGAGSGIKSRRRREVIGEQARHSPSRTGGNLERSIDSRAAAYDQIELIGETVGIAGIGIKIARVEQAGFAIAGRGRVLN